MNSRVFYRSFLFRLAGHLRRYNLGTLSKNHSWNTMPTMQGKCDTLFKDREPLKTLSYATAHTYVTPMGVPAHPPGVSGNVMFSVLHFQTARPRDQRACSQYSDKFL